MRPRYVSVVLALLLVMVPLTRAGAQHDLSATPPGAAVFDGRLIDLRKGWGEARACVVWDGDSVVECFRTEAALLEHITARGESLDATATELETLASSCSSSLRLYDGTGYTGSVLYVYQRTVWINLADYGFSNRTSSYKIGACSSYFADYANGGGSWYPTSDTEAWDMASTMISGWNDRVSSVYIT